MPGVKKEDIHMNIEGDMLTLTAEKKGVHREGDATYRMVERYSGSMSTRLCIPKNANKVRELLTVHLSTPPLTESLFS